MKNFRQQFGAKPTKELVAQYAQSPNWREGRFHNLEETKLGVNLWEIPRIIYNQLTDRAAREPRKPLPVQPFAEEAFLAPAKNAKFIWYGHSVVLFRMNGKTILIDPMLGPDASPIAPASTKRFSENTLQLIDDFPTIDLMLISHDHYDHLDYDSIQKLKAKTKQYYVALGVKRHLVSWGVAADQITEFDWWEESAFSDIKITLTPTRHFSGRGLTDRVKSLWGGWAFRNEQENIWFSGDGGYGSHFKEVGQRLGPFDFAFMECGQYNEDWHDIHLFPDESVQAALDAGVKKAMPVHWAGFSLSYQHTWQEPAEDFGEQANSHQLGVVFPRLGELFTVANASSKQWWQEVE